MKNLIKFAQENNNDDMNYPVGIQTFPRIIKEDYTYVDKTDLVWRLAHSSPFVFLSRPRRFGKSLLCSTLASYFRGERELFEGLKIMELEKEWESYPVIHLDLSVAKRQPSADELRHTLLWLMNPLCDKFGRNPMETSPGNMLNGLIQRAYQQNGKQVAVIIDEYDAPLLDVLHEEDQLEQFRNVMQEFYVQLKASEAMIKFCFITGITKFSQLSIFSTINNLRNVSMEPRFAAICGITKEELETTLLPDIRELAEANGWTEEETLQKLKLQYDGYHFTMRLVGEFKTEKDMTCDRHSISDTTYRPAPWRKYCHDCDLAPNPKLKIHYLTGMIESTDSMGYGYYEIRCKMPVHRGSHDAFWFWGAYGKYEEIDVFEHGTKICGGDTIRRFNSGIYYNPDGTNYLDDTVAGVVVHGAYNYASLPYHIPKTNSALDEYHTYGCLWLPERVAWFCTR